MNETRTPPLAVFVASIIEMMLASIRARGLRGLKDLPMVWLVARRLRRFGREFAALMAAFKAGTLPPPAPWTAPPDQEAASAQSPEPPRPVVRPDPGNRDRQQPAPRAAAPAEAAAADRPDAASPAPALPHARGHAAVRPRPPRRTLDPFAVFGLPARVIATGRSC
jgi:hypothetical protein